MLHWSKLSSHPLGSCIANWGDPGRQEEGEWRKPATISGWSTPSCGTASSSQQEETAAKGKGIILTNSELLTRSGERTDLYKISIKLLCFHNHVSAFEIFNNNAAWLELIELFTVKPCAYVQENLDRRIPHQQYQVWTHRAPVGEMPASAGGTAAYRVRERGCQEVRGACILRSILMFCLHGLMCAPSSKLQWTDSWFYRVYLFSFYWF